MYTNINRMLLKEIGLEAGLVQAIFQPCAEQLVGLLYANLEEDTRLVRKQFKKLADSQELNHMGRGEEGNITFDLKMNVILAKK